MAKEMARDRYNANGSRRVRQGEGSHESVYHPWIGQEVLGITRKGEAITQSQQGFRKWSREEMWEYTERTWKPLCPDIGESEEVQGPLCEILEEEKGGIVLTTDVAILESLALCYRIGLKRAGGAGGSETEQDRGHASEVLQSGRAR